MHKKPSGCATKNKGKRIAKFKLSLSSFLAEGYHNNLSKIIYTMAQKSETNDEDLWKFAKKINIPINKICYKDLLSESLPNWGAYIINLVDSNEWDTHLSIGCWRICKKIWKP